MALPEIALSQRSKMPFRMALESRSAQLDRAQPQNFNKFRCEHPSSPERATISVTIAASERSAAW